MRLNAPQQNHRLPFINLYSLNMIINENNNVDLALKSRWEHFSWVCNLFVYLLQWSSHFFLNNRVFLLSCVYLRIFWDGLLFWFAVKISNLAIFNSHFVNWRSSWNSVVFVLFHKSTLHFLDWFIKRKSTFNLSNWHFLVGNNVASWHVNLCLTCLRFFDNSGNNRVFISSFLNFFWQIFCWKRLKTCNRTLMWLKPLKKLLCWQSIFRFWLC